MMSLDGLMMTSPDTNSQGQAGTPSTQSECWGGGGGGGGGSPAKKGIHISPTEFIALLAIRLSHKRKVNSRADKLMLLRGDYLEEVTMATDLREEWKRPLAMVQNPAMKSTV